MVSALFYQGAPGPRGQKSFVGDGEKTEKILVVVDPATGAKSKEFVVWVNCISEVLNNDGRKRITWIGGKLIKKSFLNIFQLNYYLFVESWPPYQHSFIPPEKKGEGGLKILGHVI